jgi:RNA polymerase sigma-70 factor (ECF subfamily)
MPALTSSTQTNPVLRDPDVRLMLRVRDGDDAAFNEIVVAYQSRLIGVLRHLVQDQSAAEDLAQEVFLRIYRARRGYEPTAKFSTWLFRIANNLAINRRRDAGRRREFQVTADDSGPSGPRPVEQMVADKSALMPTRQLDKTELQAMVQSAMESLNERQRMALLLHRFEEMSYADVADTLDLTIPAVKSLLSRARESLREKLEPYLLQGQPPAARKVAAPLPDDDEE